MMQAKYWILLLVVPLTACERRPSASADASPETERHGSSGATAAPAPTVLIVGTSLTAGLGVEPGEAWPAVLQRIADSAGVPVRVVGAGVSGETSAGALRRVDWLLEREHPSVLILETGGNDGLRGLDPDTLRANILALFARATQTTPPPRLVLMAMESPPNLGGDYTRQFRAVFPAAAEAAGAALVPFFLDGIAGVDSLNQPDGIHPTSRGHALAAAAAWRALEGLLRQLR